VALPPLTDDRIRTLAGFKGRQTPVVSLYLDVDGRRYRRPHDYEHELDRLLRRARSNGHGADAANDLTRVEAHVRSGVDRKHTRGLAVFASGDALWEVFDLPIPVRNQLVVNATPHIRQLETVRENGRRLAVLLADRQRARLFAFELGELVDHSERFDRLPRHEDDDGDIDRDHVHDRAANAALHHLKATAAAIFEILREDPFDHLVVGAADELAHDLERELHPYVKERLAGRINVAVTAKVDEVREASVAVEQQIEAARQAALVERLRAAVHSANGLGTVGLDAVLSALGERRVHTLIVSEGFDAEGWRCGPCGLLAPVGRTCPTCQGEMTKVDDLLEEAIEDALNQSCQVEVCAGSADLDVMGRVGALLRY
jgi:peptide subunit release factor 1 (eRF1)